MGQQDLIGGRSARSSSEIIFKTLAITTTSAIAAGHLTTLRKVSREDSADAIVAVIGSLLIPTLPFASLGLNTWSALRILCSKRAERLDAKFILGMALGIRATIVGVEEEAEESIPLHLTEYARLVRVRKKCDSRWFGRLVVLLLFAGQAMFTVVLAVRRMAYNDGRVFASWDNLNGLIALGGVGTALSSIGVTLLNTSWQIDGVTRGATRSKGRTFSTVMGSFLGFGHDADGRRESMAELRMARRLCILVASPGIPASWWWIIFIFLPFMNSLQRKALLYESSWALAPLPGYKTKPVYLIAMRTAFAGILIGPIIYIFAGSAGRIPRFRDLAFLRKGMDVAMMAHQAAECIFTIVTTVFFAAWVAKEMENLIEAHAQGQWLEIMWVDPWAAKLYAF